MTFNIDNVYFKWDDSLKGKNVLVADSIYSLKKKVEERSTDYKRVRWNEEELFFVDEADIQWRFAYPVTKFCVVLNDYRNEFSYTAEPTDRHVFAEFDSADEAEHWCVEHDKFAEIAQAWLDGKQIQFRRSGCTVDWMPATNLCWGLEYEYRVKPGSASDFKVGKVYRNERTGQIAMCTAVDIGDSMPVYLINTWVREDDLVNWHEVEE
mgnify:CR=1 FL=1